MASHNWIDETSAPSLRFKRFEANVRQILRRVDIAKLERKYRDCLAQLSQNFVDIRIYVNAYELSEERPEQLDNAKMAKKWLAEAHKNILKASEAEVFGAADVAHLSAQIDQLKAGLK